MIRDALTAMLILVGWTGIALAMATVRIAAMFGAVVRRLAR